MTVASLPVTSSSAGSGVTTTGIPRRIASTAGRPKPSKSEGKDDQGGGRELLLEFEVGEPGPDRHEVTDAPGGGAGLHGGLRLRRQPHDHERHRLRAGTQDGPGVEDDVHVLVAPLPEGECVLGAGRPAGRPGQDVVRAQLRHGDPAGAQEGVCGQQVVVRPLRDAHDRVRLPVPDAIADPAEQAPPEAELLRP